jgi:hypothetical protein
VLNRVKIPGIVALLAAAVGVFRARRSWWPRGPMGAGLGARAWLLVIGVFGFFWWLLIAVETQAGFSGNNRYLVLGTAPVAIAGGVAWGWFMFSVARSLRWLSARVGGLRRFGRAAVALPAGVVAGVALFLAVPPWITKNIVSLPRTHHALYYQALLRRDVAAAVQRAGGREAVLRCGTIMTEGFQVPMLAWTLGVPTLRVEATPLGMVGPPWPNVIFQNRAQSKSRLLPLPQQIIAWERAGAPYRLIVHNRTFRVFSTCGSKVAS